VRKTSCDIVSFDMPIYQTIRHQLWPNAKTLLAMTFSMLPAGCARPQASMASASETSPMKPASHRPACITHFPTKDDLGQSMLQRERESLNKALAAAGAEHEDWSRRRQEAVQILAKARLPAVMIAEFAGLPPRCQAELRLLHTNMTGWLSRFATEALRRQELSDDADPEVLGNALMALAQGTALYARLVHAGPDGSASRIQLISGAFAALLQCS